MERKGKGKKKGKLWFIEPGWFILFKVRDGPAVSRVVSRKKGRRMGRRVPLPGLVRALAGDG